MMHIAPYIPSANSDYTLPLLVYMDVYMYWQRQDKLDIYI